MEISYNWIGYYYSLNAIVGINVLKRVILLCATTSRSKKKKGNTLKSSFGVVTTNCTQFLRTNSVRKKGNREFTKNPVFNFELEHNKNPGHVQKPGFVFDPAPKIKLAIRPKAGIWFCIRSPPPLSQKIGVLTELKKNCRNGVFIHASPFNVLVYNNFNRIADEWLIPFKATSKISSSFVTFYYTITKKILFCENAKRKWLALFSTGIYRFNRIFTLNGISAKGLH